MPKADILLEEDRISVVGGDGSEPGGDSGIDLEVTTQEGKDPNVTVSAGEGNVTIGGGAGDSKEGDLKLLDKNENVRVQISAAGRSSPPDDENRVWINGNDGTITLGGGAGDSNEGDLKLLDDNENVRVQITAGGRSKPPDDENRVWIDGNNGILELNDSQRTNVLLSGGKGTLKLGSSYYTVDNRAGVISGGTSGKILLDDGEHEKQDGITAMIVASDGTIGMGKTGDDPYLRINTSRDALELGSSYYTVDNRAGVISGGTSGKIFLDDGKHEKAGGIETYLKADDGVVEIGKGSGKGATPLFQIDTGKKEIRTKYTVKEGSL